MKTKNMKLIPILVSLVFLSLGAQASTKSATFFCHETRERIEVTSFVFEDGTEQVSAQSGRIGKMIQIDCPVRVREGQTKNQFGIRKTCLISEDGRYQVDFYRGLNGTRYLRLSMVGGQSEDICYRK